MLWLTQFHTISHQRLTLIAHCNAEGTYLQTYSILHVFIGIWYQHWYEVRIQLYNCMYCRSPWWNAAGFSM